jgi:hypothetical protein
MSAGRSTRTVSSAVEASTPECVFGPRAAPIVGGLAERPTLGGAPRDVFDVPAEALARVDAAVVEHTFEDSAEASWALVGARFATRIVTRFTIRWPVRAEILYVPGESALPRSRAAKRTRFTPL